MNNMIAVKLPNNAVPDDIDELFANHEYGAEFVQALNLQPESANDVLEFDEWFPLSLEHEQHAVTVNYRVMFKAKDPPAYGWVDRRVIGTRHGDTLVFKVLGRDA
jgi:hypothetical protein